MKQFKDEAEFEDYLSNEFADIFSYLKEDKERFTTFCIHLYSAIYGFGFKREFKIAGTFIEELLNRKEGEALVKIVQEKIEEARKGDENNES